MSVRLVLEHDKYMRTPAAREILDGRRFPFCLSHARKG
jgi:hypothetical protein